MLFLKWIARYRVIAGTFAGAALVAVVLVSYAGLERQRSAIVVASMARLADSHEVSFIDDYLPRIVSRLRSKGMSYDKITEGLFSAITLDDKTKRIAVLSALMIEVIKE